MADVNAGDIVRVSARMKNTVSGDVMNVYHLLMVGAGGTGTAAELNTGVQAWLSTAFANVASDLGADNDPFDIRYDVVEYVGGRIVVTRPLGVFTWTLTSPPVGSGEGGTPQDAAILNFRTASAGSYGRKYIGVYNEGSVAAGRLATAQVGRLADLAADLLTNVVASASLAGQLGAISQKIGAAGTWVDFTAAVVNAVLGVQRRRRINRGS